MEDKKYPIELEVLTPLSVGAGNDNDWIKGLDFVQKDQKVYVIDIQKAAALGVDIDRLTDLFLKYDDKGICQLLGNQLEQVSRIIFSAPVSTNNNIKSFLRTQLYDRPVIPGSSIKGSVRSALFNYLRDREERNEDVFGNMKDGTDFMRFIRIADVEMPSTILVNTKIFNLQGQGNDWQGGWKHQMNKTTADYNPIGFNTLYECVAPGQEGYGNIILAGKAFELLEKSHAQISHIEKKRQLLESPINHVFGVINQVTKNYLLKEKAFFEKYPASRTDEIIDKIDELLRLLPGDGSYCLLKMSAGVGFHSITGDWKFDDYSNTGIWDDRRNAGKKKYKSRKTADYQGRLQLMGFVKIRLLNDQEAKEKECSLQQVHQDRIEQILAPFLPLAA